MAPKCISMLLLAILVAAATVVNADEATSSRLSYRRPLPPLPCIPGRQRPPWMPPCSPPPAQPAECYTSVSGLATPCADFLTNPGVAAPAAACCDGLASLVGDAPICLCHVVNGDLNKLLPAPMLRLRLPQLRRMCAVGFPRTTLRECIRGQVPPMNPPPSPPPPPPAASPQESPSTPPAESPSEPSTPPAASPPESPSTPPPESPSTPPAASPPESPSTPPSESPSEPSTPPAASPPESPSTPPPESPAATPPESPSTPDAATPSPSPSP